MAKTDTTANLFAEIPNLFEHGVFRDGWKNWASFGSQFSDLTLDVASKSTDIATEASKEAISSLRDITTVRDDASDYARACSGFVQTQFDLSRRTAEAFFGLAQKAGTDASELVSRASDHLTETASANESASKGKKAG